jgi:hypothetical protein
VRDLGGRTPEDIVTEPVHADSRAGVDAAESRFARIERIEESFDLAAAAAGEVLERDFALAGVTVRLRSANSEMLRRLSTAFTHLRLAEPGDPSFTINLWDSAAAGTPVPPLPHVPDGQPPGAFVYYSDERLRVGYQLGTSGDARVLAVYPHEPTPVLSVLDTERAEGWYWVEDAERIPYWEQATPMVYLLDWWLRGRGLHLVHAGAVGTSRGGVLLVGKSGSGKSTSTLSTLKSELGYAGDDYVAVAPEPEPYVHGLYSSGKLMPNHVERLPFLLDALANTDQLDVEKAVVYAHEQWPTQVTAGFPLRAILAPRVVLGSVEARIVPVSRAEGLATLAPSTVFQMHTQGQDSLARMSRLVRAVPSYRLELGSDMESIPRAISELLDTLGGSEA